MGDYKYIYITHVLYSFVLFSYVFKLINTGAGEACAADFIKNTMKKGTYDCNFWQHDTLPFCYAAWSDNNIVRTLSNFHTPKIVDGVNGVKRRKRNLKTKKRERVQSWVQCPEQQYWYSKYFHLIDKGNGQEEKSAIMIASKKHNWTPKLSLRFYNHNENNAYQLYCAIHRQVHGTRNDRNILTYDKCIQELMHTNLQAGPGVRLQRAEHSLAAMYITHVHDKTQGRKIWSDHKGDNPT